MYGNCHRRALVDRSDCLGGQSVLCILSNIDVAGQFRPSTLVDSVCSNLSIADDGRILLARTNSRTVSCQAGVD